MQQIRKRLTYANVLSTIAIFLALGGATALAAKQLGKNTVGTKQIKSNSITAAKIKRDAVITGKIKDGAVTGAKIPLGAVTRSDIDMATLGTVPSAQTANGLVNRTQFAFYTGPGTKDVYSAGPFTLKAECKLNSGGFDIVVLQIFTSIDNAAFDSENGDEEPDFDPADNPLYVVGDDSGPGEPDIEADEGSMLAVAPDGTTLASDNLGTGLNIAGHPGQCFFSGTIEKLTQG